MLKSIFWTLSLSACFLSTASGQNETILLGKRLNFVWDRRIRSSNLGSPMNYYYPIYFKHPGAGSYERTGIFGRHIQSELKLDLPEVQHDFRRFKTNKKLSYVLLGGAITCLSAWVYTSARYMVRTDDYRMGAFFKPQHLPLLGGYFACFYGSIHFNLKGDYNLRNAVATHNRYLRQQG